MKDKEADAHLMQHLSSEPPGEAFKQQVLRDSTAEFIRVRQRRSARRRAELAAAAILISGLAFLGGRMSVPSASPRSVDDAPQATAESEGVTVSSDLVAWLDAAHLFNQLGMQDRMARAVERASRLLPANTVTNDGQTGQVFAAGGSVDDQNQRMEPIAGQGPHPSADSINQILAQSFGD